MLAFAMRTAYFVGALWIVTVALATPEADRFLFVRTIQCRVVIILLADVTAKYFRLWHVSFDCERRVGVVK